MNVERCIEVHNEILRHGWVNAGHEPTQFETVAKPWLDFFGDAGSVVLPDLAPELGNFLQQALVIWDDPNKGGGFSFFFWVNNLAHPGEMFEYEEMWETSTEMLSDMDPEKREYEAKRYILLYPLNQLASHHMGLIYDQKSHLCILCPDFDDADRVMLKRRQWYPLDVALEYWLNTIHTGKIVAVPEKRIKSPFEDKCGFHPWRQLRFHDDLLEDTLGAFRKLIEAIEARLPQSSALNNDSIEYGLVDEDVLQLHELVPGLAREFLGSARNPRFRFIAPGLEVMTTSNFSKQPFIPNPNPKAGKGEFPGILLFWSQLNYNITPEKLQSAQWGPFGCYYYEITTLPAGLYLVQPGHSDDACKIVVPFEIGGNGYARRADGSLYGEDDPDDSVEYLYQLGSHPFETGTEPSLAGILRNWLGMVERGDWKIDGNGVMGEMEKWKEADTEEHWEKYVLKYDLNQRWSA